jgi:hypothetical protein
MWLLGMMLYEVATVGLYFDRKSPQEVTQLLYNEGFLMN